MRIPYSPTLRLRLLVSELKQGRERSKLTVSQAGKALGWTASKISKIETTETRRITAGDLDRLMDLYKIDDPSKRLAMHALARDAKERGWWSKYREVFGEQALPDFEAEASVIRSFEGLVIPGLLQTPEYAQAQEDGHVERGSLTPEQAAERVSFLAERQAALTRTKPPMMFVVMDESCLRQAVGGPEVMSTQLQRLVEVAARPNWILQVAPFEIGARRAFNLPVNLLTLADRSVVCYAESQAQGHLDRESASVLPMLTAYHQLQGEALSPAASLAMIDQLRKGTP
jgi:transcriptional regulator with XRE-family HTH domain